MQKGDSIDHIPYVLITPAHNEEAFIEKTIVSVINQTVLPVRWMIVDDGSTDKTPEIISRYLPQHSWIEMVQMPQRRDRSFAAKVQSFNAGYEKVKGLRYEVIGNLDADISFDKDFLGFLVDKFAEDLTLGVAGTIFKEEGYSSETDSFEGQKHVSGQCQLFRKRCFEEIGGYIPHRAGGIDWMAVTTARMLGWKTQSFREKWFFHYRSLGTAGRSPHASLFSYGEKDYYLGGHPIWEIFRVAYRAVKRPYITGGMALGLGYCWALLRRTPRPVSRELMAFHRQEQMHKLKAILKSLVRFKRVDNFNVIQGCNSPPADMINEALEKKIGAAIDRFIKWLDRYGEISFDHQTFFASDFGRSAKALYYRKPLLGTLAVSPMIFCEAFVPSARKLFWKAQRFPIADAHYAMGFAFLSQTIGREQYYKRAVHFLEVLKETRSAGYDHYCWGYPFNWETRNGTMTEGTPLITTLPYAYEAFRQVYQIDGDPQWRVVMNSIAQHALQDYRDFETSPTASSCTYKPGRENSSGVINASAYRAFLLTMAAVDFSEESHRKVAERNLNFVIESQNANGSWFYSTDGERDFVDHFHTCFVLKALAKIEQLRGSSQCRDAIERGVSYYVKNLFDSNSLPMPFSKAPRLTVYRHELYDYAECINMAVLLQGRFPELDRIASVVITDLLTRWQKPDGSFRARKLLIGWDNVPMHRWAQSQVFRSLCFYQSQSLKKAQGGMAYDALQPQESKVIN